MKRSSYVLVVSVAFSACKTGPRSASGTAQSQETTPPPPGAETAKAVPPTTPPTPPAAEWVGPPVWMFNSHRDSAWAAGDHSNMMPSVMIPKRGSRGDVREIYKKVAPATVIVHAGDAMGSGVLIRDSGWLLTNYHVVRSGQQQDLFLKVGVELGTLDPKTGVMARTNKILPATVQKVDLAADLALVKIDQPPPGLPFVKLGTQVVPGEPVTSLGHASIGLLWAIKDGEVSAIGNVAEDRALAELVLAPCTEQLASTEPAVCDRRKEQVAQLRDALKRSHEGLVIQTTCEIWHGDSGGPLVNRAGELVGLNDFGYSDSQGGPAHSNFHIHLNDIRSFLEQVPAQPHRMIPDPFAAQGMAKYADLDDDGVVDTLGVQSDDGIAFLFDLSQTSMAKYDNPRPSEALGKHSFDTRVAVLRDGDTSYVLYDTAGKGHFDVVLVDAESRGIPTSAYRVDGDQVTKDDSLVHGGDIKLDLLKDAQQRERLAHVARAVFTPSFLSASMGGESGDRVGPTWKDATGAAAEDDDGDGTPDTYRVTRDWDQGFILDASEKTPHANDALAALHAGSLQGQMSFTALPDERFAFYDTDGDGNYDLALHARTGATFVDTAFAVDGNKLGEKREDYFGQLIVQPALVSADAATHKRAATSLGVKLQQDSSLGAFPDAVGMTKASDELEYVDVPKWDHAAVQSSSTILIDANRARARKRKGDAAGELASGKFAPQFAYLTVDGTEFFFYDTAGRGRFDVVLVTATPQNGVADIGYRLAEGKRPVPDDKLRGGKLVRASLFKDRATGAAFGEITKAIFNARAIGN